MKDSASQENDRALFLLVAVFAVAFLGKQFEYLKPVVGIWIAKHPWHVGATMGLVGLVIAVLIYGVAQVFRDRYKAKQYISSVTAEASGSTFAGKSENGERIFIPLEARRMHTQVIGTTNAGKSESVIIPWAVGDMKDNRGFVIVDGKADKSFIQKMYAYSQKLKRAEDFKVFSLQDPTRSHSFNPLLGGTPEEVAERVFNSFEFDNSYYESVQYEVFSQVLRIFSKADVMPTFLRIYQAIKRPSSLHEMAVASGDESLIRWATNFKSQSPSDREEKTSGLLSSLSHFSFGAHAALFNTDSPDIDLQRAMKEGELIYFQLPVLKAAFLGKATGKLVLQCLQSAVANRHAEDADQESADETSDKEHPFFSIYLDDFTEYLYSGFVSLLNKSRSANVGVVFAHQALGDIKVLGEDIATSILTNSNLKVVMRGNDPDSAEYFAKVIGTKSGVKATARAEKSIWGKLKTGQESIRDVEEFVVHPNVIKRNMGVGEALVIIPHRLGTKTVKLKFAMRPSLPQVELPRPAPKPVLGLESIEKSQSSQETSREGSNTSVAFAEEKSQEKEVA